MHWYWLAIASLADDRQDTYQRACDELVSRFDATANRNDLIWIMRTWLVVPHDTQQLKPLQPLVDAFAIEFPRKETISWLYDLRTGITPGIVIGSTIPPVPVAQPEEWYFLALAWLKVGDKNKARTSYESGIRQSRSGLTRWDGAVYRETLRREVEVLINIAASPKSDPPSRAATAPASPSDASPNDKSG